MENMKELIEAIKGLPTVIEPLEYMATINGLPSKRVINVKAEYNYYKIVGCDVFVTMNPNYRMVMSSDDICKIHDVIFVHYEQFNILIDQLTELFNHQTP